jgi:hypothetical protein
MRTEEVTGGKPKCSHCWHPTHVVCVMPPINVSKCCHCGAERKVTISQDYTATCEWKGL